MSKLTDPNLVIDKQITTDEWETPQELFNELNDEFGFTLDPCASADNYKCEKYFTKEDDGLDQDWSNEILFINPPYGNQTHRWVRKAFYASRWKNATCVLLIPARTDTKWWHDFCKRGEVRFIKGRIRFSGSDWNAPFASAIVIFRRVNARE